MSKTLVSAATVRAWARENINLIDVTAREGLKPGARGRLHPAIRKAYDKAHKGKTYVPKAAEGHTFTVPVVTLDRLGRKTTVKRTVDAGPARDLIGASGKRGRIALGLLSDALSAVEADKVADQFV